MVRNSKPGDLLFFHYSGHGSYILDKDGDEIDGCDEMIVSSDMYSITDDELKSIINDNLNNNSDNNLD